MEMPPVQILTELFTNGNYHKIIKLTASLNLTNPTPKTIFAYYYRGLSFICINELIPAVATLSCLFTLVNKTDHSLSPSTKEIIANIAAQLINLAPLIPDFAFESIRTKIVIASATTLYNIGKEANNISYLLLAQQTYKKLIPTCHEGYPGMFYRFDSPLVLQIEPTNTCNLNCRMCPRINMTRKQGFMDESIISTILNTWSNHKNTIILPNLIEPNSKHLVLPFPGVVKLFFMGEPLLHPRFDKIINLFKERDCLVGIQTNGLLLNNSEIRKKILLAQPHSISFSIDGIDQESYRKIRKGSDFDKIVQAIQSLHSDRQKLGLKNKVFFNVSTIIAENTPAHQQQALKFLEPIKSSVDHIAFIKLEKKYPLEFIDTQGNVTNYSADSVSSNKQSQTCREPLEKLNILWDGTVTPCCNDINGILKLGEVTDGIDTIWNSDKTRRLQIQLLKNDMSNLDLCAECLNRV